MNLLRKSDPAWLLSIAAILALTAATAEAHPPLALHPDNPHYFLFRGQPTVLITSAEHYGAVLNLDFDYVKYLAELQAHGLNLTRTFVGSYVEDAAAFNIAGNTLAPKPERFICPWARSNQPGYAGGGNKFDLHTWDEAYFRRLRDFVDQAGRCGVVVEVNLFCPFYEDSMWRLSPQQADNNIQRIGQVPRTSVYTLDQHGGLLEVHEALTRKIVSELQDYDNVYFEICNEPYFGGVTMDWQRRIADVIGETERPLKGRHLISLNVANGSATIRDPHPDVSIFNFHYASPPDAVAENFALNKVIGDNETGFQGTGDTHYRMEAWQFLLAGGGLFNHLDYSFSPGYEDGSFPYPNSQPGGGNRAFRAQMRTLADFMRSLDFIRMSPNVSFVKQGIPAGVRPYGLAATGRQYALYLFGGKSVRLTLDLPAGQYVCSWIDPVRGATLSSHPLNHPGGPVELASPGYDPDIALRLLRP